MLLLWFTRYHAATSSHLIAEPLRVPAITTLPIAMHFLTMPSAETTFASPQPVTEAPSEASASRLKQKSMQQQSSHKAPSSTGPVENAKRTTSSVQQSRSSQKKERVGDAAHQKHHINNTTPGQALPNTQHRSEAVMRSIVVEKAQFKVPPTPPDYPVAAKRLRQQGTVIVEIWLDENGIQLNSAIARSSGFSLLDSAALAAVQRWQFKEQRANGQPIAAQLKVPVRFSLN
ncbi:energy transducer TonB [Serratia microhaemolytica]|uniref:energy transducer TonB n=1 Tax=Serratia microhaemolytica TaxID=2675110 RepID=UPI0013923D1E|nr:energy transducer TonB [Serratia microhaemolytica]